MYLGVSIHVNILDLSKVKRIEPVRSVTRRVETLAEATGVTTKKLDGDRV
jgi:hypothetical protein